MSDLTDYLERTITSLTEHAADAGHCQAFRDQCRRDVPKLTAQLRQARGADGSAVRGKQGN